MMPTSNLFAFALSALLTLAGTTALAGQPGSVPQRPTFRLETTEAFDPATVKPYRGEHADIYEHIDESQPAHIANIQRWLRQKSISALNEGIPEMAALLRDDFRRLGCQESELVPTAGHPGVWAYCDYGAPKTLVVYMMYDVQPVDPWNWKSKPFEAAIVEHDLGKVIMARGAANQKGPERAFLNSIESILAVKGKLPVNLMFAAEGEEELGSPHYPEVIAKYAERMKKSAGVIFPMFGQIPDGSVTLALGVKGILYFEMEAVGGPQGGPTRAEIHGSYKAIVDSPAWRLTQALASLTSRDGNTITVPGYYDAIRPPSLAEQRLVNGLLPAYIAQEPTLRKQFAVERWTDGWTGAESLLQYLFNTTLNIDGLVSGYIGEGTKTILPHRALAKVDSRLVPDQKPDEQLALIRRHLDSQGFSDIAIRKLSGYPPAQTSVESPVVQAAIGVYSKYGLTPSVAPRLAGSAPYYVFTDMLKLPVVPVGIGHGAGQHAPNEFMVIDPRPGSRIAGLAKVEKFYVDLLYALE
jgi:acetylornithine deacetylase/succinyl-diaminopimelate desuccinylase-like protein